MAFVPLVLCRFCPAAEATRVSTKGLPRVCILNTRKTVGTFPPDSSRVLSAIELFGGERRIAAPTSSGETLVLVTIIRAVRFRFARGFELNGAANRAATQAGVACSRVDKLAPRLAGGFVHGATKALDDFAGGLVEVALRNLWCPS